ncbi:hypothetical protein SCG7109_AL_00180 [Chlamydiales bacterium SCGC AG-110-M15]|nr:hypothetical protein SCG7109_AL_00180 [Chlamydiales bacterium SCGC AG-110-M15]
MTATEINLLDRSSPEEQAEIKPKDALRQEIAGAVEAMLFTSSEPVTFNQLRNVVESICPVKPKLLKEIIEELRDEYKKSERAFQLDDIGGGYLLRTRSRYYEYVEMLHNRRRSEKLSRSATIVLSIIAYKQPVTRAVIDGIRGVDSSGILYSLLDRELIEVVGRANGPGRPSLYATTKHFMQHFGLKELSELVGTDGDLEEKIEEEQVVEEGVIEEEVGVIAEKDDLEELEEGGQALGEGESDEVGSDEGEPDEVGPSEVELVEEITDELELEGLEGGEQEEGLDSIEGTDGIDSLEIENG